MNATTGGSPDGSAGVWLGTDRMSDTDGPVDVAPEDPRLAGMLQDYKTLTPGCYIWSVLPQVTPGDDSDLSQEDMERLRALGY